MSDFTPITDLWPENVAPGYEGMVKAFFTAYQQASGGKGTERHGSSGHRRQADQPIYWLPEQQGHIGGLVYQVCKKALEAEQLAKEHGPERGAHEMAGVLVYAAVALDRLNQQRKDQ